VSSPGFKTYVQKGIVLDAGTNRTQAVTMEVGATTESIQVTANATQPISDRGVSKRENHPTAATMVTAVI
jgi:hypothetical protein